MATHLISNVDQWITIKDNIIRENNRKPVIFDCVSDIIQRSSVSFLVLITLSYQDLRSHQLRGKLVYEIR